MERPRVENWGQILDFFLVGGVSLMAVIFFVPDLQPNCWYTGTFDWVPTAHLED